MFSSLDIPIECIPYAEVDVYTTHNSTYAASFIYIYRFLCMNKVVVQSFRSAPLSTEY